MTEPANQNVSSLQALISSIETDKQVYQWFLLLITQPSLSSDLNSSDTTKQPYQELKKVMFQRRYLLVTMLALALVLAALKFYLVLAILIVFLYPLWKLSQKEKNCVLSISDHLLQSHFDPETLPTQTLYQVTEILSRQYNIPSLVDAIYTQDNIARKTIIFTFVFTAWIYPLTSLWAVFFCVIVAYFTIQTLMNTSVFYNNLKITTFEKDDK